MRIFDPVAGGEALLVLEVGSVVVHWLSSRTRRRARRGLLVALATEKVRVFDPVAGGEALLVLDVGDGRRAWRSSKTRRRAHHRQACRERRCLSSTRSRAERRCSCRALGSTSDALAVFAEPVTSAPRLACGSGKVRVFDAVAGGDALLVLDVG